jgi:polar amino acid transport system substrate-binding protein
MLPLNSKAMISYGRLLAFVFMAMFSTTIKAAEPPILLLAEASPFTLKADTSGSGGEATAFVEHLLAGAQQDYQLSFEPWKRAYLKAQTNPNVLIYPIARDATREEQFHWVGQLIPVAYYLFRLTARDDISINGLEDAKKWQMGVVNEHIHHQYLKDRGFENLQPVNSNYQNVKKALLGRIALFPMSDGGMMQLCSRDDLDCSSFKPVLKLDGISNGLYLAASSGSDQAMIQRLMASYQSLVSSGQHEETLSQRLLRIEEFNHLWPSESMPIEREPQ